MSKDIIRVCQPDPKLEVFVLGGMSWRVSLHTQQRRAIDLVEAISPRFKPGSAMAVIGGGAAGVMCAAALLQSGYQVTLFERAHSLLSLQRKARTRFIHPNSVTWPYSDLPCTTDLPYLNWHSAYSHEIADLIEQEFRADFVGNREDGIGISVRLDSNVTAIESVDGAISVHSESSEPLEPEHYAAVFITTGFNAERKISGFDRFSYWEDTSPVPLGSRFNRPKVAIIGDGDGALVELVRCIWGRQNLDELYRFVVEKFIRSEEIKKQIVTAEEEARTAYATDPAAAAKILAGAYSGSLLSPNGKNFLRNRADHTVNISIVSRYPDPFSPRASPIHKVLLGFLLDEKIISSETLDATSVEFLNDQYYVRGSDSSGTAASCGPFRRVLERIGPERSFCPLVQKTFGKMLVAFTKENAVEYDFANPNSTSKYPPRAQQTGPLGSDAPIDLAVKKLRQYFRANYDKDVMDVAIGLVDDATDEVGFRVSLNSECVKQDGPKVYSGYRIRYEKAKAPPRALSSSEMEWSRMSEHGQHGEPRHRSLDGDDLLCAGQSIFNLTSNARRSGRIATFVTPRRSGALSLDPEIFCLTAAHAIGIDANAKVGIQLNGARFGPPSDDGSTGQPIPKPNPPPFRVIGRIDASKFSDALGKWRTDPAYNCLKDICIVRIEPEVRVRNLSGANSIMKARSSSSHFLQGGGKVYVRGHYFGQISRVRAEPIIIDPDGHSVRTSGFFVERRNSNIQITPGSSGRPVFTDEGDIVGMIIASAGDELFCVDVSEVLDRLECDLLPDMVEGAVERALA